VGPGGRPPAPEDKILPGAVQHLRDLQRVPFTKEDIKAGARAPKTRGRRRGAEDKEGPCQGQLHCGAGVLTAAIKEGPCQGQLHYGAGVLTAAIKGPCQGRLHYGAGVPTAAIKERRALDARSARQGHWMQGVRGAGKKEWIRLLD